MLRQAVITDEISQDFERAVAVAQAYALEAVEVRSAWGCAPQDLSPDQVRRMRAVLADSTLSVCCIASPFFKCSLDSRDEIARHLDILRRCIDLGGELGCTLVRGFTFWREESPVERWHDILDQFDPVVDILNRNGVLLGIENEPRTYVGTGVALRRLLQQLDCPRIRAVWDPANSLADAAGEEAPYPDGFQAVAGRLVHVHVKDGVRTPSGFRLTPVGEGAVDFLGQFAALLASPYGGFVSLETHWRAETTEADLDRPGGEAFSAGGEAATRLCLENIRRLIDRLEPAPEEAAVDDRGSDMQGADHER